MPRETELVEDIEGDGYHGVHVRLDATSMPYRVATFDGSERVSEWKAGLQKDDEIWFAQGYLAAKDGDGEPTLAEEAAAIIREHTSATVEANVSDSPKEQYVDVYPDPHEQSSEDFSLNPPVVTELRSNGIELRSFSGGRTRSRFNEEEYRIWFEAAGD
jgi:hypothetical protein